MERQRQRYGYKVYASERDSKLLEVEFFLNYIAVASRKVDEEHCVIRLILSALATPEEISNLTKRDLRSGKFYSVRLFSGGKSRISPIDEKTFRLLKEISENLSSRDSVFRYSKEEIDEMVRRNSPPSVEYDAEKLRSDAARIISDNMFFEEHDPQEFQRLQDLSKGKDLKKMYLLFEDSNPLYSGAWDVDDDLMLAEFLRSYQFFIGYSEKELEEIADKIGEPVERLKRVLEEF
jgi:hypothetical protein